MGSKDSKEKKQNKKEDSTKENSESLINLTNEIFIGNLTRDPNLDYSKINFLGEGSFAAVYRVKSRITGEIRAMKIIKKSANCTPEDEEEIFNEINILRKMDHPNIIKIFEFYSNPDSYSLLTEICSGGELFQIIIDNGPFNEQNAAYIMYQIFSAVNYCHNMNIVHRDLKPENILIVKTDKNGLPMLKICDFGTSKIFEKGNMQRKLVGSSYYIAPEVLKKNYNEKCDLWSCGVILYILLSARPPFPGESDREIMMKVSQGKYDLSSPPFDECSNEVKDLIKSLLVMNPSQRISAEEALNHPWLKKFDSREMFNKITDSSIIEEFIENLKNYKSDSVIQETALAYLVHNFSQREDVVNACKLFNQMDISGDGKINKQELLKGLQTRVHSDTLEKDVDLIFKNIDADNNGYIQYEEFVRAAINKESFLNENVLRFAFRYFDKDNSGEIDYCEIQEVFEESITDKNKVKQALKRIIDEVDVNGDGKISFEEFSGIMRKMLEKRN